MILRNLNVAHDEQTNSLSMRTKYKLCVYTIKSLHFDVFLLLNETISSDVGDGKGLGSL